MIKVFIVNGGGGSGKDTFEGFVKEYLLKEHNVVYKLSIIDSIKELVKPVYELMGLNPFTMYKTNDDRKFLSDIKLLCQNFNDFPFRSLQKKIESIEDGTVFIDMREPEDIDRFISLYGSYWDIKTVLLRREDKVYGNVADDGVENYEYDAIIENTGTLEELAEKSKWFANEYIIKEIEE